MTRRGSLAGVSSTRTVGCGPLQADPGSRPWVRHVVAACCLQLRSHLCQALIQHLTSTFIKFVIFLRKPNKNVKCLRIR